MPKKSFGVPTCMESHMDFLQSEEAKSNALWGSVDPEYDATGPQATWWFSALNATNSDAGVSI